jgi:hypothetical protein
MADRDNLISVRVSQTLEKKVIKFARPCAPIYETRNYNAFCLLPENRPVRPSHVAELEKSMSERYVPNPIMVTPGGPNGAFFVIDGQHTRAAVMNLGLVLYFQVVEGLTMDDMVRLNKKNRNWGPHDYLHHYVARGFEHYIFLEKFWREDCFSEVGIGDCVGILTNTNPGGNFYRGNGSGLMNKFRDGKLVLDDDQIKKGRKFVEYLISFDKFTKKWSHRNFIHAMQSFWSRPEFDKKRMLAKMVANKEMLPEGSSTVSGFGNALENIYNWKQMDGTKMFINWKEVESKKKSDGDDDGGDRDEEA